MERFYVKFGDPNCSGSWDIVRIIRQTDRQTNASENPTFVTAIGVD